MERISTVAHAGADSLKKISQWTQGEFTAGRQRYGGQEAELRPRKRARTEQTGQYARPAMADNYSSYSSKPTVMPRQETFRREVKPTTVPGGPIARQLVLDSTENQPSAPTQTATAIFTGATVAASEAVGLPTLVQSTAASASVVVVTASASATAAPSSGMSITTEAIIISCSIAGALVLVTLVCLLSICYRKKKRRQRDEVAMKTVPRRMQSSSTMHSDTWKSESSEPEKQSLINASRSRSASPASRGPSPNAPAHAQQRSLGGYRPFMDTIPEASQPPSPTSVYTKKSPPQPGGPGELQLEYNNVPLDDGPHSPLRPPPLRIRQGAEGGNTSAVNSTLLPSPRNMFSAVRLPFLSGTPNGNRRSSTGQSMASSLDEERGMAQNRRTMESETLPAPGMPSTRYRDSFWSVAASSVMRTNGFKSTYGDSVYGAPGSDLRHTRTDSTSSGGHLRTTSDFGANGIDDTGFAAAHARSHSSVNSARKSEALIPALPPMPSRFELDQKSQGHKSGLQNQSVASVASQMSGPPGGIELKSRLHSVDFWAIEERDMRLGTFAPAELEGSGSGHPTPITEVPTPLELPTPRDSRGMVIGAAMASTPRNSNPYFAGAVPGTQGGYSVAIQDGDRPVRESALMPQGYSHEATDDGRRLWNRGRSRDRSEGRTSSSTVATVFKQHPGDMVMI